MKTLLSYRDALALAIGRSIEADERVFIMGEDVGAYGGSYAVTQGFLDKYGPERVRDTPLSESGFVGAGIGAALGGLRPIVEVMTVNFSLLALDQIVNNAATLSHMSGGQYNVPIVIRMATGAGRQLAAQHSHSWEGWYAHVPGLKIFTPSSPEDAYYAVLDALADPNPVLIFEHALLYGQKQDFDPDVRNTAPSEKALVRREGKDLTIATYGGCVPKVMEAAATLAEQGLDVEVVDIRCLRPFDQEAVLQSVAKTNRLLVVEEAWKSGSFSAEVCACVAEEAFYHLEAPPQRLCGQEVPIPYAKHLEVASVPQVEDITRIATEVIRP